MKRIFFLTDFTGYGGPKSHFLALSDYLIKRGKALHLILASRQSITDQEYDRFVRAGVKFNFLPGILLSKNKKLTRFRINKLLQFLYLLFAVSGPYEKVIVSTGHSFYFLTGAWLWGKKFFYILHTYPQGSPSGFTRYLSGFRSIYYSLLAKRGFTFITVSKESRKIILDFVKLPDAGFPVNVIYNSCRINPSAIRKSDSTTVVTCGHLEKWKNPDFWLEVALSVVSQNPTATFIWAGTGSLMQEIMRKIPETLQSKIILAGYVASVSELLSGAAVYFQPSLVESQGISVVEAMAHSLPCVVSNRGGLPEAVEDGITGYIIDLEVQQACQRLLYLIENKELSNKMGVAGYEKYEREYSDGIWEQEMEKLLFGIREA